MNSLRLTLLRKFCVAQLIHRPISFLHVEDLGSGPKHTGGGGCGCYGQLLGFFVTSLVREKLPAGHVVAIFPPSNPVERVSNHAETHFLQFFHSAAGILASHGVELTGFCGVFGVSCDGSRGYGVAGCGDVRR